MDSPFSHLQAKCYKNWPSSPSRSDTVSLGSRPGSSLHQEAMGRGQGQNLQHRDRPRPPAAGRALWAVGVWGHSTHTQAGAGMHPSSLTIRASQKMGRPWLLGGCLLPDPKLRGLRTREQLFTGVGYSRGGMRPSRAPRGGLRASEEAGGGDSPCGTPRPEPPTVGLAWTQPLAAFLLRAGSRICRKLCAREHGEDHLSGVSGKEEASVPRPVLGTSRAPPCLVPAMSALRGRSPPLCWVPSRQ